jgi:hypothetical protein
MKGLLQAKFWLHLTLFALIQALTPLMRPPVLLTSGESMQGMLVDGSRDPWLRGLIV